jgi:hypothetical protein
MGITHACIMRSTWIWDVIMRVMGDRSAVGPEERAKFLRDLKLTQSAEVRGGLGRTICLHHEINLDRGRGSVGYLAVIRW